MTSNKIGGSFSVTSELRWRITKDGLYQSIDGSPFKRIASHYQMVSALYAAGMIVGHVSDDRRPELDVAKPLTRLSWNRAHLMDDCIAILRSKLRDRGVVVDVDRHGKFNPLSGLQTRGFKLSVRGVGPLFAVKEHVLRRWLPGAMPLHRFLAEVDRRGWLLRGADGMTTRQVVIPGYGRLRFYCFKLEAAGDRLGEPYRDDRDTNEDKRRYVARSDPD